MCLVLLLVSGLGGFGVQVLDGIVTDPTGLRVPAHSRWDIGENTWQLG